MRLITLVIIILFGIFYVLIELCQRRYNIPSEYTRKFAHLSTGIGAIIASPFLTREEFLGITFFFFILFAAAHLQKRLRFLYIKTRKTYGELTYPLGLMMLAFALYPDKTLFTYGLLSLAIPDALAGLVGARKSLTHKTLNGSITYLVASLALFMTGFDLVHVLILATVLTIIEYLTPYGLDNLSVPAFYTLMVSLLF